MKASSSEDIGIPTTTKTGTRPKNCKKIKTNLLRKMAAVQANKSTTRSTQNHNMCHAKLQNSHNTTEFRAAIFLEENTTNKQFFEKVHRIDSSENQTTDNATPSKKTSVVFFFKSFHCSLDHFNEPSGYLFTIDTRKI